MFVSVGDDKGSGQFLLAGNESVVNEVGPKSVIGIVIVLLSIV